MSGGFPAARAYFEASLALYRELGDIACVANSLKNVGYVAHYLGDNAFARFYLEESRALYTQMQHRTGLAYAHCGLGLVAHTEGELAASHDCYAQALTLFREIADRSGAAFALRNLAYIARDRGDYDVVWTYGKESLLLNHEIGRLAEMLSLLLDLASLTARQGRAEAAAVLWGRAEAMRAKITLEPNTLPHISGKPEEQEAYARLVAQMRETLGETAFAAAWSYGRSMSMEQAVVYAQQNRPSATKCGVGRERAKQLWRR